MWSRGGKKFCEGSRGEWLDQEGPVRIRIAGDLARRKCGYGCGKGVTHRLTKKKKCSSRFRKILCLNRVYDFHRGGGGRERS